MWLWFINLVPAKNRVNVHRSATAGWKTFGYARGTIISGNDGLFALIPAANCEDPPAAPLAVLVMIGAVIPLVGAPAAMVIVRLWLWPQRASGRPPQGHRYRAYWPV